MYLAKSLSEVLSSKFKVLFSTIDRAKSCNFGSSHFIKSSQSEGLSPSCIALSFDGFGSIS
jgi:hypothetical protein